MDLEALVDMGRFGKAAPFPGRIDSLRERGAEEVLVLGWLPAVDAGRMKHDDALATFDALNTGWAFAYCPHEAGPPKCWCRKPLPGLIVEWMRATPPATDVDKQSVIYAAALLIAIEAQL